MPAALPDAWLRFCLTLVPPNACGCCSHLLPRKPWRRPEVRWRKELLALLQAGRQRSPAAVDWPAVVAVVVTAAAGSAVAPAHPAVRRRAAPAAPCHCPAKLPPLPVRVAGAGACSAR